MAVRGRGGSKVRLGPPSAVRKPLFTIEKPEVGTQKANDGGQDPGMSDEFSKKLIVAGLRRRGEKC